MRFHLEASFRLSADAAAAQTRAQVESLRSEIEACGVDSNQEPPRSETVAQKIKALEAAMQELEPVNMRALEEYEHQMERKKKFDEDIGHLNDQKKNLVKVVGEITSKKTERFFEVYNEINKDFKEVYAQLSEGGEAELLLENEESVFE